VALDDPDAAAGKTTYPPEPRFRPCVLGGSHRTKLKGPHGLSRSAFLRGFRAGHRTMSADSLQVWHDFAWARVAVIAQSVRPRHTRKHLDAPYPNKVRDRGSWYRKFSPSSGLGEFRVSARAQPLGRSIAKTEAVMGRVVCHHTSHHSLPPCLTYCSPGAHQENSFGRKITGVRPWSGKAGMPA